MLRVFVHFFAKHQQVLGKTSACFQNPFYDIMNEELKDIKGSFFTDRSCIEISYNILCNKVCSTQYIFFVKNKIKKVIYFSTKGNR